jgi:hypothetical protein
MGGKHDGRERDRPQDSHNGWKYPPGIPKCPPRHHQWPPASAGDPAHEPKVFDATLFSIPGMKNVMDPPLEIARLAAAGIAILLFALISLFLTVIVVNYRTIVRLITFHMDEWKKFMAGARIWLLLFVGMCLVFYYAVVK